MKTLTNPEGENKKCLVSLIHCTDNLLQKIKNAKKNLSNASLVTLWFKFEGACVVKKKKKKGKEKKKKNKEQRTKESEGEFFSMLTKQANDEMFFHLNLMTLQSSSVVDQHYIWNSTVLNQ